MLTASVVAPTKETGEDAPSPTIDLVLGAAAVEVPDVSVYGKRTGAGSGFSDIASDPSDGQGIGSVCSA